MRLNNVRAQLTRTAVAASFVGLLGAGVWVAQVQASTVSGSTRSPLAETLVPCSQLKSSDVPDRNMERNTVLDEENGLLQIDYYTLTGDQRTISVDYVDDSSCRNIPEIRDLISETVADDDKAKKERCPRLKEIHAAAVTEEQKVKGKKIDREALGRYIKKECTK